MLESGKCIVGKKKYKFGRTWFQAHSEYNCVNNWVFDCKNHPKLKCGIFSLLRDITLKKKLYTDK